MYLMYVWRKDGNTREHIPCANGQINNAMKYEILGGYCLSLRANEKPLR